MTYLDDTECGIACRTCDGEWRCNFLAISCDLLREEHMCPDCLTRESVTAMHEREDSLGAQLAILTAPKEGPYGWLGNMSSMVLFDRYEVTPMSKAKMLADDIRKSFEDGMADLERLLLQRDAEIAILKSRLEKYE